MNKHLRKIESHVEIIVAEGRVLLGIKRFEQSRRGIAAEVAAYLVNFVEHEHRIFRLRASNALDDLPRQRSDVSAPMAANFGLVMHAAERQARELASQSAGNRFAQRSFSHARRADETQNRSLHAGLQTPHGKIIENAIFDLLQIIVIGIENFFRLWNFDLSDRKSSAHGSTASHSM